MFARQKNFWLVLGLLTLFTVGFEPRTAESKNDVRTGSISHESIAGFSQTPFFVTSQSSYTSPVHATEFPFNGLGVRWQGDVPAGTEIQFFVKVREDEWSDWLELPLLRDTKQTMAENFSEPVFLGSATALQYRVELKGADNSVAPRLDRAEFIYFDTGVSHMAQIRRGMTRFVADFLGERIAQAEGALRVVSRADWGANESYRFTADGREIWPAKTSPVQKIIIHHTAGGSGQDDPQATIRGIYYWHAKVLGWGDIGYNYLVDQEGTIYEGRYGGDGVIGGHTFNSETNTNYNVGSLGISILGCFEETGGACTTLHNTNDVIHQSLISLIANKSALWTINPEGSTEWHGRELPNILGHRDVDQTFCPGSDIYDDLASIREQVGKIAADGENIPALRAEFMDHTMRETSFINDTQTVSVRFKNSGSEAWGSHATYLEIFDSGYRVSRYSPGSWPNEFGRVAFNETEVAPGQTATFTFITRVPFEPGLFHTIWRLKANDQETINGEKTLVTRADSHFQVFLTSHNIPSAMLTVWRPEITVKFKNVGHASWDRKLLLDILGENGGRSAFVHPSWPDQNKGSFVLKERQVKNSEYGTFTFRLQGPVKPGLYQLNLRLRLKDSSIPVQHGYVPFVIRVDAP